MQTGAASKYRHHCTNPTIKAGTLCGTIASLSSRPTCRKRGSPGFTLIELSIVLVIIGLIVGGVLVGRDLVEAAKIRSELTQLQKFTAAIHTFKVKYNEMPGDMTISKATQFFGTTPKTCGVAGCNGNGVIEGEYDSSPRTARPFYPGNIIPWAETLGVFIDLCSAKLAECATDGIWFPRSKLNNNARILPYHAGSDGKLAFFMSVTGSPLIGSWLHQPFNSSPSYSPAQALSIDKKIDDGVSSTGGVLAIYRGAGDTWMPENRDGLCVNTSPSITYNIEDKDRRCMLTIRAGLQ